MEFVHYRVEQSVKQKENYLEEVFVDLEKYWDKKCL